MCQQRLSTGFVLLLTGLFSSVAPADEAVFQEDKSEPSVSVLCQGRLRHGVMAIGGETTGTTITFHRVTWELKLPDEASREFAERHHKKPVVVTGTLRKVVATESKVRWIIDVTRLTEPDARQAPEDSAQVTIRGTLRAALSRTGNTPDYSIRTDGQLWNLNLSADRKIQTAAESLIGQPVHVTGIVPPPPEKNERPTEKPDASLPPIVRVKRIQAVTSTTVTPRAFE